MSKAKVEEMSIEEVFHRIYATMASAIDDPGEKEALKRMEKLAKKVYEQHFEHAESIWNFSLFIACLMEAQKENFERGGITPQ